MSIFQYKKNSIQPDVIPATVEHAIPMQTMYEDGICLVGRNLWSKTFRFTDINYAVASKEDKEGLFLGYSDILNAFDSGATTKITVNNRRINLSKFEFAQPEPSNYVARETGGCLGRLKQLTALCRYSGRQCAMSAKLPNKPGGREKPHSSHNRFQAPSLRSLLDVHQMLMAF